MTGAMSEPRPFASLSPGLLARKGSARPAMRRQDNASFGLSGLSAAPAAIEDLGWNDWGGPEQAAPATPAFDAPGCDAAAPLETEASAAPAGQALADEVAGEEPFCEEQGADGSTEAPMASLSPEMPVPAARKPDVLRQIEDLAERINRTGAPARSTVAEGRRAAFTLRLDAERHFRLKMAGVLLNRSAQTIVTEALDKYLAEFAEVSAPARMAAKRS